MSSAAVIFTAKTKQAMGKRLEGIQRMLIIVNKLKESRTGIPKNELIRHVAQCMEMRGYSPVDIRTLERDFKEIAELSSLTPGDTKNVIDNLVTVMTRHLQASESVTLDGLGTFRFTLVATGKGAENEEDVTTGQSTLKVRFLPASTRHLDGSLATRSLVNGARFVRFDKVEAPSAEPGTGEGEDDGDHQLG